MAVNLHAGKQVLLQHQVQSSSWCPNPESNLFPRDLGKSGKISIKHNEIISENNYQCNRSFKIIKLNPLFEKLQYREARPPNFHLGQAHSKVGFVMSHDCYSIQLVLQGYGDAAG